MLVGCDSQGDPKLVAAQARAVKEIAADSTNTLLYLTTGIKLQLTEQQTIEAGSNFAADSPSAKSLSGFQSLAPRLIGMSQALRMTRTARTELRAAIARANRRLEEIQRATTKLAADLSADGPALGSSAKILDKARAELESSETRIAEFIARMTDYVQRTEDAENDVNAMLRELDILTRAGTAQTLAANIVRLNAFNDHLLESSRNAGNAFRAEDVAKNAGLGSLLRCFQNLISIDGLPTELSTEMRQATKLLDDVIHGASFSPKT